MESFFEAVSKISKNKSSSIGKVVEITGNTCKVERENLPALEDVRLNAIEGDFSNKIIIFPKIGSEVLCLIVAGAKEETAIVQYTEIDKVLIEIDGAKFEMSGGKFQIKNEVADQKKITKDLLTALDSAIILTPNGPGKFADTTKAKFTQIKNDNENLYQ
ncbi:hypothetical protein [Amniculibacterium sp. G2-70]|uniref:hypothetical protein n=1 Tax=Amniculibacterium sp. G2-70 TaxID=2767188 RepID=UPI001654152E|nr:hypothetical protein [Amniculibacterium sp. G2-70]